MTPALLEVAVGVPSAARENAYIAHTAIYDAFAKETTTRGFVFGYEPELGDVAKVRSRGLPAAVRAAAHRVETPAVGQERCFRLIASPARNTADGRRGFAFGDDAARVAWLQARAAGAGFSLLETPSVQSAPMRIRGKQAFSLDRTVFCGRLRVEDAQKFEDALEHGVGRFKSYGVGLLSIY